jgi:hypothetical protein
MSTYKSTSGDYIVTLADGTGTMYLYGNLDVVGNVTYIETQDLRVDDPFITVAANNNGTIGTAAYQHQGMVAQTSATTFAGLRFDNGSLTWQISANVDANGAPITAYTSLATAAAASAGGPNSSIQFNTVGNTFGGSANLLFDSANSKVTLIGHQVFGNIGTAPTSVSNAVAMYNNAVGAGGTGLYVKSAAVDEELVSKTKAIVFSLIF